MYDHGIRTQAVYIDKSQTRMRFSDSFMVDYRFMVDGQLYLVREPVTRELYERTTGGAYLDIVHDREDHAKAMIIGNDRLDRLLWIYGLINAAFLLAGWNIRSSVRRELTGSKADQELSN